MNSREVYKKAACKRRNKKILLLFLVLGITIVGCAYTTYAWFVGIDSVKVNNFTIDLNMGPSLEISLDGYTWSENLTITENTIKAHSTGGSAYNGNTNSWVGEKGLVPVSSSGDVIGDGKLRIFTKTSLDASAGGYRLTANQINNSSSEKDYYIAFDIFVKNNSGDVYDSNFDPRLDENIYLTSDSTITSTATGTNNYGIQNTARVAFIPLGRTSIDNLVTGTTPNIKCISPADGNYTSLCDLPENMEASVIWEPNELAHSSKLLAYYNLICREKYYYNTVFNYTSSTCASLSSYTPTYTIKKNITSNDNVDIYDGLNNYFTSVQYDDFNTTRPLQNTVTFTDTMKNTGGQYTFMKLHPHSVTKIRVYVYLEGQDVDNYDLITNDQNIIVKFGFTKERSYYGELAPEMNDTFNGHQFFINNQLYYYNNSVAASISWREWVQATFTFENSEVYCNEVLCVAKYSNALFGSENYSDYLDAWSPQLSEINYPAITSEDCLNSEDIIIGGGYYFFSTVV